MCSSVITARRCSNRGERVRFERVGSSCAACEVGGVTQPHIKADKTSCTSFELRKSGSFMYHPHSDETVQKMSKLTTPIILIALLIAVPTALAPTRAHEDH